MRLLIPIPIKILLLLCIYSFALLNSYHTYGAEKNILVLVSDRSTGDLMTGVHRFLKQQPDQIQIRSVSQINLLSQQTLKTLINQADTILILAVFGEPVARLLNLSYPAQQTRLVISADRRLFALHHDTFGGKFSALSATQRQALFSKQLADLSYAQQLQQQQEKFPQFKLWLQARAYWQHRGATNIEALLTIAKSSSLPWQTVQETASKRFYYNADKQYPPQQLRAQLAAHPDWATVFIFDHDTGDRAGEWAVHQALCTELVNTHCISILAAWGEASVQAIEALPFILQKHKNKNYAIISLQDFVIGGGAGRKHITQLFNSLNVPVFKGVRLTELNQAAYHLSSQGLPADSVHYRIAMPELQGIGQAHILALAAKTNKDTLTGAQIFKTEPVLKEIKRLQQRIQKWLTLQQKSNAEKKVAIIFYNHPPGRHNIGADNLNVPNSLWEMLQALKAAGYNLGDPELLPKNAEALLDILQQKAVNLPEDAQALAAMSPLIHRMSPATYEKWFTTLPDIVQQEMIQGPLGFMHQRIGEYLQGKEHDYLVHLAPPAQQKILAELAQMMDSTVHDLQHALDGVRHKGRERALNLLAQLEEAYHALIHAQQNDIHDFSTERWAHASQLKQALVDLHIEGIRGWGAIPGKTMVWEKQLLIPGVQFGNIFLAPQPPRGWELNEELLHANMSFPPPHQYLAFYHYLADEFKADALLHVGRHSTYEFLPKRAVGLSASDYPSIIVKDIPSIYPYIVDGVGEGIQAKRRGMAVMVDHLTPPLAITELYDGLLQLRQLIESAEAASDAVTQQKAIKALRHKIDVLNLRDELIASMDEELQVRGVGFSEVDDDFLLHEVGHYLTHLQEKFMPLGLHVFGRNWSQKSIDTMMKSMQEGDNNLTPQQYQPVRQALQSSPAAEMQALLNGLNGGFINSGKGNDPIRTPEALPTGRNFYALDSSLLPSQLGYDIGQQLAIKAREQNPLKQDDEKEAVILWASDAVRDEGAMIAFGLDMLGVKPIWNSRGIIKSLQVLPLDTEHRERRDVVFTTSGLFRDLYGAQLALLDKAVLLALSASRVQIQTDYPALYTVLNTTLKPIAALLDKTGHNQNDPLEFNQVARNWVKEARQLLAQFPNEKPEVLARQASIRIFGTAAGAYGAGINRLVERSGAWTERKQLGEAYIKRMGHAYGIESTGLNVGSSAQQLFSQQLAKVSNTYLGRASNMYGLMDNNDAFDYLGGLNLAIETVTGQSPNSFVINHANSKKLKIDSLEVALLSELRGRFLNRQWIEPLMKEGYAGARTMGSEFIEYLWGWQVTSPEIIDSWVWDEVKSVYIDDALDIGLDKFLQTKHNVQVQSNILAVMLVAIDKGFWETDEDTTQQLAQQFAESIIQHGIPGSGHTHANHPVYEFIQPLLTAEQAQQLADVLAASRMMVEESSVEAASHIQEIAVEELELSPPESVEQEANVTELSENVEADTAVLKWLLAGFILLLLAGFLRARYSA